MNTTNPIEETATTVVCPIVGCVGPTYDENSHIEEDPALNLHNAEAYISETLEVVPAMFAATEGRWILDAEIAREMTPAKALETAENLRLQGERVKAMNAALDVADAAAWIEANPDLNKVWAADVCRIRPFSVVVEIMSQLKIGAQS